MRSGTSFFNGPLFRKTVLRFWPLWFSYAFVLALALAYYAAYRLIRSHPARIKGFGLLGGAVLFMLALLLIVFTYLPPHLPWFCDPLTGSYGLA